MKVLRHRADFRTLCILSCNTIAVATFWRLNPSGWACVGAVALTCLTSWLCAVIAHNVVPSSSGAG